MSSGPTSFPMNDDDPINQLDDICQITFKKNLDGMMTLLFDGVPAGTSLPKPRLDKVSNTPKHKCTLKLQSHIKPIGKTLDIQLPENSMKKVAIDVNNYLIEKCDWMVSSKSAQLKHHHELHYDYEPILVRTPRKVEKPVEKVLALLEQAVNELSNTVSLAFDKVMGPDMLTEIQSEGPTYKNQPVAKRYTHYMSLVQHFIAVVYNVQLVQEWMFMEIDAKFPILMNNIGNYMRGKSDVPMWTKMPCMIGSEVPVVKNYNDLLSLKIMAFSTDRDSVRAHGDLILKYPQHAHKLLLDPYHEFLIAVKYCRLTTEQLFAFLFIDQLERSVEKRCPCGKIVLFEQDRVKLNHTCTVKDFLKEYVPSMIDGEYVIEQSSRKLLEDEFNVIEGWMKRRKGKLKWVECNDRQNWVRLHNAKWNL